MTSPLSFVKVVEGLTSLFEEEERSEKKSRRAVGKRGKEDILFHYFGGGTEIFMIQK